MDDATAVMDSVRNVREVRAMTRSRKQVDQTICQIVMAPQKKRATRERRKPSTTKPRTEPKLLQVSLTVGFIREDISIVTFQKLKNFVDRRACAGPPRYFTDPLRRKPYGDNADGSNNDDILPIGYEAMEAAIEKAVSNETPAGAKENDSSNSDSNTTTRPVFNLRINQDSTGDQQSSGNDLQYEGVDLLPDYINLF
ncbi:hypothetical protein R1sor_013570 [Riccia sorocarpa]|uniref:Uncharacterized protein n=1 Tax=Riccia sorocarpa TaxID=122646 RepID=A0ABD3H8U6_9MARC